MKAIQRSKTSKVSVSMPADVLEAAQRVADRHYGGMLSRYFQALVAADLGAASAASAVAEEAIPFGVQLKARQVPADIIERLAFATLSKRDLDRLRELIAKEDQVDLLETWLQELAKPRSNVVRDMRLRRVEQPDAPASERRAGA